MNSENKNTELIKQTSDDEMKELLDWRNSAIDYYTHLCANLRNLNPETLSKLENTFKNVPKCLEHINRYKCKCDEECMEGPLKLPEFSQECPFFNLVDDNNYVDCSFLGKEFLLLNSDVKSYFESLSSDIYDEITKICYNEKISPSKLYFQAYLLRDMCKNKQECIDFYLNKQEPILCYYTDYLRDIRKFKEILGLNSFKDDFIRDELTIIDERDPCLVEEEISHRKLLSVIDPEYQELSDKTWSDKLSENQVYIYFILGMVILSSLGCVGFKRKSNGLVWLSLSLMGILSTGLVLFNIEN